MVYHSYMVSFLKTTLVGACTFFLFGVSVYAASLVTDVDVFEKAKVVKVFDVGTTTVPGFDSSTKTQTITVEVLEGVDAGRVVTFKNDYVQLSEGDLFYLRHQSNHLDSADYWTVSDPYRLNVLVVLIIIFVGLIFVFGGIQGVRGLVSLLGSFVLIFYALIPSLYQGYSVLLVSIGVSSLIIVVGSYITHGFTRTTTSAVIGMIVTVLVTGVVAYYAVYSGKLSGYNQEESMYLSLNTRGGIDMVGLLFGGIIIGLLGVLYDIAIGQAVAVEELFRVG